MAAAATALFAVGGGAVAGRARTLRDDGAVAQRPGAGTRVLGVHGLTGRCECARCVTWGSSLPDGDPKILVGRDPESRIFFWNTRFFPCCACHFRKIFVIRARLRFFCDFSKILVQGNSARMILSDVLNCTVPPLRVKTSLQTCES